MLDFIINAVGMALVFVALALLAECIIWLAGYIYQWAVHRVKSAL